MKILTRRAVYFPGPGVAEIREEAIDSPRPGEVLVQTVGTSINAGTYAGLAASEVQPWESATAWASVLRSP